MKIFVFCNQCGLPSLPSDHHAQALSEEGLFLAGHVCSAHGFIPHDMGATSDWKHDVYKAAYPDGFEVEYVEKGNLKTHEGVTKAYAAHEAFGEEAYKKRMEEIRRVLDASKAFDEIAADAKRERG